MCDVMFIRTRDSGDSISLKSRRGWRLTSCTTSVSC